MNLENKLPILVLISSCCIGCISIKTHEDGVHAAYIRGLQQARYLTVNQHCDDAAFLIGGKIDAEQVKP